MKQPKRLQIEASRNWGWGKRAMVFLTVFGFLWLALDPLFSFIGQDNPITELGIWGYIILIGVAAIITVISEQLTIQRIPNEVSKVQFTVIIAESGQRYPISVPHDMRIADFLKKNFIFAVIAACRPYPKSFRRDLSLWLPENGYGIRTR